MLVDFIYLDVDLNIKDGDDEHHMDRRLNKGLHSIDRRVLIRAKNTEEKTRFTSTTLHSWLSTAEVEYTVAQAVVEATVEFKVIDGGDFRGKITASTTGFDDVRIVLHDSEAACGGAVTTNDGSGIVPLLRRVLAVHLDETLMLRVEDDQATTTVVEFAPFCVGNDRRDIASGAVRLQVKMTWSFMDSRPY